MNIYFLDICHCGKCNEIVYGNHQFRSGHNRIGISSWNLNIPMSEISKEKSRRSQLGIKSKRVGKKDSLETRKKKSNYMSGRKKNYDVWNKGKPFLRGTNNPMYGRPSPHGRKYWYNSPLQGSVCLFSSYELAYAKYLDSIHEPLVL